MPPFNLELLAGWFPNLLELLGKGQGGPCVPNQVQQFVGFCSILFL